ncbi:MAG: ABC transporter ATP-binding protein [Clostridia bacterium]|nr:ABC transporter ATP-binding protein [Clostridia bacterium]NCC43955.1 ABC transporter ATP-binding protein [Clostridia bacterium]
MDKIIVNNLTKDYGHGRGIYDVSFSVKEGEVFGFLGPNGAGKSTTMRHLMGFSKPQKGKAGIDRLDCWKQHGQLMKQVGYLPGEVALPDGLNSKGFVHMMQRLRNAKNQQVIKELLDLFQLKMTGDVKKLSIGEKRKLAIVAAFMNDPDVLLLDEPTSGLDPVMQEIFIGFIKEQKKKGKTVLLSSHIFNEVEALCDRIAIIKEGKIITVVDAEEVRHYKRKTFEVTFQSNSEYDRFKKEPFEFREEHPDEHMLAMIVEDEQTNQFVQAAARYEIAKMVEHQQTLEEYFMHFYKSDRTFGGI